MIEAIVDYIQQRGFTVRVYTNVLVIRKKGAEGICGADMSIPQCDLTHAQFDALSYWLRVADAYMAMIDKYISVMEPSVCLNSEKSQL